MDIKENIILPAWKLVKDDAKIKKIYFFPGLLSILFLTWLLVYQSIYTYVNIFNKKDEVLVLMLDFFHSGYFIETIITALIFLFLHLFVVPVFEGGLISYIDEKNKTQERVSFSDVIGVGVYRFLPLFEYNNFSQFKIISVLNAYLFTIRFIGLEYMGYVTYVFLVVFFFSIVAHLLFAYSKYEIVLKTGKVLKSISKSAKITILNPKMTIQLYFMMILLNIRVIFNFLIFLFFPIIIFSAIFYITSKFFLIITLIFLISLFLIFIVFLGYFASVMEVFKIAIWYYAYIEGEKKIAMYKDDE
ncbi:hypothetical protein HGA92_05905 [Candidatus Gracilibacteria bacterium]|nr:hypothetical protein [Candidatus Gracilibacteria bacterium]NUJ98604.1 hypothetical protein [Candidatus Gracilibacteria bacterium]